MADLIDRQVAIDAIFSEPLYESGMKKRDADEVVPAIYEKIKALPPVQISCENGAKIERYSQDTISRQAAIDALDTIHYTDREDWWAVLSTVENLPPVQPKRGKWNKIHWKAFRCSECNRISEYSTNFCPNCGADMRGGKDGYNEFSANG